MIITTLFLAQVLSAGETAERFAPPVQLTADGKLFDDLYYPSPVLQDVDGDGRRDLVVGDLVGSLWIAAARAEGQDTAFGARGKLKSGSEPIRLNNW